MTKTTTKADAAADKLAKHIAATVASWPAPTPEQVRKVTLMARAVATGTKYTIPHERPEVTAIRKAEEALSKVYKQFEDAMQGCRGCGLTEKVHQFQSGHGLGYHRFVALTPDEAIKVARVYKKSISAAETDLEAARGAR